MSHISLDEEADVRIYQERRRLSGIRMLIFVLVLYALGVAFAGCGESLIATDERETATASAASTATATATRSIGLTGTIAGDVVASPTCPVQQAENPCPPAPVANREVDIDTASGAIVATTTTDANGRFSVAVRPGSYIVRVKIVQGQVGMRQETPGNVTVSANQTTTVQIVLDTGIR